MGMSVPVPAGFPFDAFRSETMKIKLFAIALLALGLASALNARAQTRGDVFALTNARIVTVSGAAIEKGTIVVRDGLIESVGADARVPADARIIDAAGLTIYPGVFDALMGPGSSVQATRGPGAPQPAQTAPASSSSYPAGLQAEKDIVDDLRGGDAQFEAVRNAGFTSGLMAGREGIFAGRSAVVNLAGETVSGMVIRDNVGQHFFYRTLGQGTYPNSLIGTFAVFRQMLLDAKRLQNLQKAYAANPRGMKRPESDRTLEALFPVINGSMPVVFNVNSEIEIIRSLDLAKEFGIKAIIAGGQESWKVADRLKSMDVPVLLSLNYPKRTAAASPDADPEPLETLRLRADVPKGAGVLAQKGVRFAFQSGGASPADFFANALKSTENGLSKEAAVRAMTLSAAEIFGVSDRLGSIEPGKIANLTVTRGEILGKDRSVTHVIIDGRIFEQKERPRTAPATTTSTVAVNAAGRWNLTIEVPGQQLPATLTLTQDGTTLNGTFASDATGSSPIRNGKLNGDSVSFTTTVTFSGATFDLAVIGKVAGNQISGSIDSPQGAIAFTGNKVP